jgi:polysaccharide export outer membrane protein
MPIKGTLAQVNNDNEYQLSVDDQISITIFNEPEMSIENIKISSSGRISLPLIGQVNVKSLTVTALENELVRLYLEGFLKNPNVTISITEYRPFYISGQVEKPGSYPYRKDLTIEKAVVLAGGFTVRASKTTISLVSEDNNLSLTSAELTDDVKPGDIITVNESFF